MTSFNCNHSCTYVLRVIILGATEKNKTGISGCGSFVVVYCQPATSIDCLHNIYVLTPNAQFYVV